MAPPSTPPVGDKSHTPLGAGSIMSPMPTTAAPPRRPPRARGETAGRRDRPRTRCTRSSHPHHAALARYYDPTIGRFTATDPLIDADQLGSLDRFGYGRGSPISLKDPTGLKVCDDPRECKALNVNPSGRPLGSGSGGTGGRGSPSTAPSGPAVRLIVDEINRNSGDAVIEGLTPPHHQCKGFPNPFCYVQKAEMEGLWGDFLPVGLAMLGNRFRAGGEWDHKGQIRELTGGATWLLIDSERAVRFDVFSNIHYGYLLAQAEFSEDEAQTMANLGEELPGPAEKIFGVNDASDRVAIHLGYQLQQNQSAPIEAVDLLSVLGSGFDDLERAGGACLAAECSSG